MTGPKLPRTGSILDGDHEPLVAFLRALNEDDK